MDEASIDMFLHKLREAASMTRGQMVVVIASENKVQKVRIVLLSSGDRCAIQHR
jgi:hypothetical protein